MKRLFRVLINIPYNWYNYRTNIHKIYIFMYAEDLRIQNIPE